MRNYKFERMRRKSRENGKARGLSDEKRVELAEAWGLVPGARLEAHGAVFVFSRVGGWGGDGRPWVWAYRLKKNGTTYSEPTKLDRWEKECTTS